MAELLPEAWRQEADRVEPCCRTPRPRQGLITDMTMWAECYATMAALLASHYPSKAPHLLAYLRTIVRASHNFEGSAWASYDACYRRQTAVTHSLDSGVVDPSLYSQAFTGRARIKQRIKYCLDDTHSSRDCTYAPSAPTEGQLPTGGRPPRPDGQGTTGRGRGSLSALQPPRRQPVVPVQGMQICSRVWHMWQGPPPSS